MSSVEPNDKDQKDCRQVLGARGLKALGVLLVILFLLFFAGLMYHSITGTRFGQPALVAGLLQLPIWLLLAAAFAVTSVGALAYGLVSLVVPRLRASMAATLYCLVGGAVMTLAVTFIVLPLGILAPVQDIPYLAQPVEGTVYAEGIYNASDPDSSVYYLYIAPQDLPGAEPDDLMRVEIGWKDFEDLSGDVRELSLVPTALLDFPAPTDAPVYRVKMLPHTRTILSIEPVG